MAWTDNLAIKVVNIVVYVSHARLSFSPFVPVAYFVEPLVSLSTTMTGSPLF